MTKGEHDWPERPHDLELLARYDRRLRATPEGVWRNVLDYEHLPWVHGHAFAAVERLAGGHDWWRARVTLAPASFRRTIVLELRVDRARLRYVTRTLEGPGQGGYILTRLAVVDDASTDIEVEFWAPPDIPARAKSKAHAYRALYERLWDEDEAMIERMLVSDRQPAWVPVAGTRLQLVGAASVSDGEHELGLATHEGQTWVHDSICPHMGGPLSGAQVDERGQLRCPWHDYRFGLADGRCDRAAGLRLTCRAARRIGADHVEI